MSSTVPVCWNTNSSGSAASSEIVGTRCSIAPFVPASKIASSRPSNVHLIRPAARRSEPFVEFDSACTAYRVNSTCSPLSEAPCCVGPKPLE